MGKYNIQFTQLTAHEVAGQQDEELWEFTRGKREYQLACMSSRTREKLLDDFCAANNIEGGWCWYVGQPGCLPDSAFFGPFATLQEAQANAEAEQREWAQEEAEAAERKAGWDPNP